MKTEKKKMNTYLKFGLKLLAFALLGAVIGFCLSCFEMGFLGKAMEAAANGIREHLLPIQTVFLILAAVIGEPALRKLRALGEELENAEDEQGDQIEYEMERISFLGMVSSIAGMVLAMILLATGYSMDYIASLEISGNRTLMFVFLVFILNGVYNGYWQVRYVKTIQKIYPKQKADIASMKFQEQWLKNCDEAEREMIYQASYQTYLSMNKLVSVLAVAAMLCHLLWNTGILAVAMVGIIWIALTFFYCRACVKKKRSKLNT